MEDKTEGDTLLAHLAGSLSRHPENIAVEALGYILKSEPTLRVMEAVLKEGGADVGTIAKVRTQLSEGETRPDLVGLDRHGEKCVSIEAKFWAGLTEKQPNAYLERLPPGKALLFVAPELRIPTLWSELRSLAGVEDVPSDPDETDFKSVTTGAGKRLMLISWRRLLDRLEAAGDSQLRSEIQQLRGLADRVDASEFLPLRPEEFAPEIPRRLVSLRRLVDQATKRAVEMKFADISGLRVAPQAYGYGRYLRLRGGGAWFGIDSDLWARGSYPDTPLWLRFSEWGQDDAQWPKTHSALETLMLKDPPECFEEDGQMLVPVPLPTGIEYCEVREEVVGRLRRIADLFNPGEAAEGPPEGKHRS